MARSEVHPADLALQIGQLGRDTSRRCLRIGPDRHVVDTDQAVKPEFSMRSCQLGAETVQQSITIASSNAVLFAVGIVVVTVREYPTQT
ncbi:hypothetical protein B2J88_12405 [Rhodococcus sp. SRB_17]|nr:hypothetical protein [Rhodococcus sp. SRB_17]